LETCADARQFSIHKVYPFTAAGVAESQKDITSRGTTGKLLIKVADEEQG
jgi:NADPH2:quinone reductase